ncbi:MAG: hypothetical protein IJH65_03210 [Methanobrevibacter sp.]|nr:hypothetical protein [Methanobrevibacter sp.]
MISKSDVVLLLTELQDSGEDVSKDILTLYKSDTIPLDILKRINDSKPLSVVRFYEKIRKSYNNKHSKMYINIMRSDENATQDAKTILTTLSGLLNQILQFECDDKPMFLKHVRADEITKALEIYFKTFNIEPAFKLLKLIKADVKVLQMIKE